MNYESSIGAAAPAAPTATLRVRIALIALWLASVAVASVFASFMRDSSLVDGVYIPLTTDSLYHAHRILDVVVEGKEFYQFEERLHYPDGAWIPWPWAYDYLMIKATQIALWLNPGLQPLAFLSHVAIAWLAVNAALLLAATGSLNLSFGMRALVMLGFSLSPLTQLLHGVGQLDHHFIELTFVLLNLWLGLEWFRHPERLKWPIALGCALGVAPAFHNGLFVLQLMPLACIFVLWLRHQAPPARSALAFSITLVLVTQLILLPSEPYRQGMFEFGLLSWFHFCAAVATAAAVAFMACRPASVRSLLSLGALSLVLSAPMLAQVLRGASFISGEFSILDRIVEAHSPYVLATRVFGFMETVGYYSWLLLLAPVFAAWFAFKSLTTRNPVLLFYAVTSVFGLLLLLTQFRFHYFGLFALLTAGAFILERLQERHGWHRGLVFVIALAAMAFAVQPSLDLRLFKIYAPGADPMYANVRSLYAELSELCSEDPGLVLTTTDDGNAILFHTDCSIIANNFILRPEDDEKIREVGALMSATPQEIRDNRPDIKYLLIRMETFKNTFDGSAFRQWPLADELLTLEEPPEGFETIQTVFTETNGEVDGVYARLFRIVRD